MEILSAFLLAAHPNFGCDCKNQSKCINGLHLTLFSHRGGALFLEMEILSAFLLAPHPHANFILFSNIGCGGKNNENV